MRIIWSLLAVTVLVVTLAGCDATENGKSAATEAVVTENVQQKFSIADNRTEGRSANARVKVRRSPVSTLGTTAFTANSILTTIANSAQQNLIAVGTDSGELVVFDQRTGKTKWTKAAHQKVVSCVAFHPAGNRIATAASDGHICIWDSKDGKRLARFAANRGLINGLVFSPDGKSIYSGGRDRTIRQWSGFPPRQTWSENLKTTIQSISVSPKGEQLAAVTENGSVHVWSTPTHKQIYSAKLTDIDMLGDLGACTFLEGGVLAVGGEESGRAGRLVTNLWLIDAKKGQVSTHRVARASSLTRLIPSPNGRVLLAASSRRAVCLLRVSADRKVKEIWTRDTRLGFRDLCWMANGRRIALLGLSDHRTTLWGISSSRETVLFPGHTDGQHFPPRFVDAENTVMTASNDGTIRHWSIANGKQLRSLELETLYQESPEEFEIVKWEWPAPFGSFSPDAKHFAVAALNQVDLLDSTTGLKLGTLKTDGGHTDCVAHSPNGKRLIAVSRMNLFIWDYASKKRIGKMTLPGVNNAVTCHVAKDNRHAAIGSNLGVAIVDISTQKRVLKFGSRQVHSVQFSRTGTELLTVDVDSRLDVWTIDFKTRQAKKRRIGIYAAAAFHPNGKSIAAALGKTLFLLDPKDGHVLKTWTGHRGDITNIVFNRKGTLIATTSRDTRVLIWSAD